MSFVIHFVYAVACLGTAGCTLHYLYAFLYEPITFDRLNYEIEGFTKTPAWIIWIYLLCAWFGIGYMIYSGAMGALSWMPQSWRVERDGEYEWAAHGLAFGIGFLGMAFGVSRLSVIGRQLAIPAREKRDKLMREMERYK